MNDISDQSGGERRSHYRVDDDVYLEYLVLGEHEMERAVREFSGQTGRQHFNPLNQMQALAVRNGELLKSVREKYPEVGDYLAALNEQIQLLAHAIAHDQVGVPIVPNESVNISAGGLSFCGESPIDAGTLVEFSIIVVPSYLHISALGKVVYCQRQEHNDDPAYPYRIGVEFTHIHEADREALLRHVRGKKQTS